MKLGSSPRVGHGCRVAPCFEVRIFISQQKRKENIEIIFLFQTLPYLCSINKKQVTKTLLEKNDILK